MRLLLGLFAFTSRKTTLEFRGEKNRYDEPLGDGQKGELAGRISGIFPSNALEALPDGARRR